jgi:hypothetical protein
VTICIKKIVEIFYQQVELYKRPTAIMTLPAPPLPGEVGRELLGINKVAKKASIQNTWDTS